MILERRSYKIVFAILVRRAKQNLWRIQTIFKVAMKLGARKQSTKRK